MGVLLERYASPEEIAPRGGWSFAMATNGGRCATICGVPERLASCAGSSDSTVRSCESASTRADTKRLRPTPGPSHAYGGAYFGLGTGAILLGGVACTGAERSLLECARYYGIGTAPCSHYQDVGVACTIG